MIPNALDDLMLTLLGYADTDDLISNWREESTSLVNMLAGDHGWAIYKAMLARIEHARA